MWDGGWTDHSRVLPVPDPPPTCLFRENGSRRRRRPFVDTTPPVLSLSHTHSHSPSQTALPTPGGYPFRPKRPQVI